MWSRFPRIQIEVPYFMDFSARTFFFCFPKEQMPDMRSHERDVGEGHLAEMYSGISDSVGGLQTVQGFVLLLTSRMMQFEECLKLK